KVWSRPLSKDELAYLMNLPRAVIIQVHAGKARGHSFIRVDGCEAIISKFLGHFFWPYVGYADLSQPVPRLEYRTVVITHLLTLVVVFIQPVFLILMAAILAFNFWLETRRLDRYLNAKVGRWVSRPLLPQKKADRLGKTVNELLVEAGLLKSFDQAVLLANREQMAEILQKTGLTSD
ncbi:MAG: hypothetical protein AB1750_09230, partial [Chloroflexota bacterium]